MPNQNRHTIVFLESAAAMGGVQFSTLYLAAALDKTLWRPIVVSPEEGDLTVGCRESGVESCVISSPRLWSTSLRVGRNQRVPNPFAWFWNFLLMARAVKRLRGFLRDSSPEVVVTKGLASHFIGGLAARWSDIPCVWHVQDLISERSFGIYRRIFSFAAARLPQNIIVDGAAIKQQLPSAIHSRITVIHNGVDTNVFRPGLDASSVRDELGLTKDQVVIGHAARITPWKGQHHLIEAFARIAGDYPEACLLIVGSPVFDNDAYQNRLHLLTADLGLGERIKFTGYRHDLHRVLAAMDVFAFTSIEKDTSPLALLSAMSSGLPIVAFDIPGVRELFDDREEFLRVPVGRAEELAASLAKLISDPALRARLGKEARENAEQKFSLPHYVNRVVEVLEASFETEVSAPAAAEPPPATSSFVRNQRKIRYAIAAAIFLFALGTRVAFVNYVQVKPLAGGDGPSFERMANTIVRGETARSTEGYAVRMPGFPFLIAQVYRFGESHYRVYLLQAFIGALSAITLFFILLRFNFLLSVIAAVIFSIHPVSLLFTEQILSENVTIFFLVLMTYLAIRTIDDKFWALAMGCVWGFFILTRSEAMLTMLPTVAAVGLLSRERRLFKTLAPIVIAVAIVSPWAYRNYLLLGRPTLQTAFGWNFYVSFNPKATGSADEPPRLLNEPPAEADQNIFYLNQGLSFIKHNPGSALRLGASKQSFLWQAMHNPILDLADLLLLPLALLGIILMRHDRRYLLLLAPVVAIVSLFFVFQAVPRYRVPMYPFLITFGAVPLAHVIYLLKRMKFPSRLRTLGEGKSAVRSAI